MSIRSRLTKLEAASASPADDPRVVTEEEFDELSYDEKIAYLRGSLRLIVLPDREEGLYHLPSPADIRHITAAELDAYRRHMDGYLARCAARSAARTAAKAAASGIEEKCDP